MPYLTIQGFLNERFDAPREVLEQGWVEAYIDEVSAGTLWIGDPLRPTASEGCVIEVPNGFYRTEAIGLRDGHQRVIAKLRILPYDPPASFERGPSLGEVSTLSGVIGVCDIENFATASPARGSQEDVLSDIMYWIGQCNFGFITLRGVGTTGMSYLPIDGNGSGHVWELWSEGRCVGMEAEFVGSP